MNILVYLKQVTSREKSQGYQEVGGISQSDKNAVVQALNLRDSLENSSVTIMALGGPSATRSLKEALSMGVDKVLWVSDDSESEIIEEGSRKIAEAIRRTGPYDLIICGRQALDGDSAHMAAGVSEILGIPMVCYCKDIQLAEKKATLTVGREDGTYNLQVPLPVVVMTVKGDNAPRYSKISDIMKAYGQDAEADGVSENRFKEGSQWKKIEVGSDGREIKGPVMIKEFSPELNHQKALVWGSPEDLVARLESMNFVSRQGGRV